MKSVSPIRCPRMENTKHRRDAGESENGKLLRLSDSEPGSFEIKSWAIHSLEGS